jgi:hypothetical protein
METPPQHLKLGALSELYEYADALIACVEELERDVAMREQLIREGNDLLLVRTPAFFAEQQSRIAELEALLREIHMWNGRFPKAFMERIATALEPKTP